MAVQILFNQFANGSACPVDINRARRVNAADKNFSAASNIKRQRVVFERRFAKGARVALFV